MPAEDNLSTPEKIIATVNALSKETPEDIRQQLILLINELINTDFHALIQLLYRVDIDEEKLKKLLGEKAGDDSASLIADIMIKRQVEKMASKHHFMSRKPPTHDDSW